MSRFVIVGAILFFGSLFVSCESPENIVRVAAASSMQPLLEKLANGFEEANGIEVDFVWGSSGSLSTQIIEGAPFDIFFAASEDFANRVKENGEGIGAPNLFCKGRLAAVFADNNFTLLDIITDKVRYISLPDPKSAPYGIAAMEWLERRDWVDLVNHKFVYAPSASGVINHIEQGVAEFGITAESVAKLHFPNEKIIQLSDEGKELLLSPKHFLLSITDNSQSRAFRIYTEEWAFGDSSAYEKVFVEAGFDRIK